MIAEYKFTYNQFHEYEYDLVLFQFFSLCKDRLIDFFELEHLPEIIYVQLHTRPGKNRVKITKKDDKILVEGKFTWWDYDVEELLLDYLDKRKAIYVGIKE